jgi:hypothetical protein
VYERERYVDGTDPDWKWLVEDWNVRRIDPDHRSPAFHATGDDLDSDAAAPGGQAQVG